MGSILANSSDNRWLSSQRSTARCMFSHTSGLVFSKRASFKAVAAVTGWSSARIRCRLWRDMLSRAAISETDNPVAGRISAFNASPGCVGLRVRLISDNPPGQLLLHPIRPSQRLSANWRLREPNNVPQNPATCGNEIPEDSFLPAVLPSPGSPTISISANFVSEVSFDSPQYKKTHADLCGERSGSPECTVTFHATFLQTKTNSSSPNLRNFWRVVCRKNKPITVRKWSDRPLSTAADIPLHSKLFLHQVRSNQ